MPLRIPTVFMLLGLCQSPQAAGAVEGGVETYLLGSRDSLAGVLPPPGTYWNNDFVSFSGSTSTVSAAGAALVDPEVDVFTYKLSVTRATDLTLGSARLGFNLNLPYVSADLDVAGELQSGVGSVLTGEEDAFGDLTLSGLFGWTNGNLHTMLALQFFLPTGDYNTASVDLPDRQLNALNAGKNRFAFDPTLSMTWLNPDTGLELTGALGVTISAENEATDYQTAPEVHFEGTVMQHLPNKLALGVTGYAYQQLRDDSGDGTVSYKAVTGVDTLRAQVFGLGPIVTWSTVLGKVPLNLKAKWIREFGARNRFESDKAWITVGLVF